MTSPAIEQDFAMLTRTLVAYVAWLTMVFVDIPAFVWIFVVIAAPMTFGSVIWHLRKNHSRSVVNQIAFCGALAFFPVLAIQIFVSHRN
jgi:hypothetical protein